MFDQSYEGIRSEYESDLRVLSNYLKYLAGNREFCYFLLILAAIVQIL